MAIIDPGVHSYMHHLAHDRVTFPKAVTISIKVADAGVTPPFDRSRGMDWQRISYRYFHVYFMPKCIEDLKSNLEYLRTMPGITNISGMITPFSIGQV